MSPESLNEASYIEQRVSAVYDELIDIENNADAIRQQYIDSRLEEKGLIPPEELDADLVDSRIVDNTNTPLITPYLLDSYFPTSAESAETTRQSRSNIEDIISGRSDRLLVVVGPCSTHDISEAVEYGNWLGNMREECGDNLEIVMRNYVEKPRTDVGWKGKVNDPHLNETFDINWGVATAKLLFQHLSHRGLPQATERLNTLMPQFFNKVIALDTIGARSSENQGAREYGSGSSSPTGYKNSTDGNLEIPARAVKTAAAPHNFVGMNNQGRITQVETLGNPHGFIILRGGGNGPNYSEEYVRSAKEKLRNHDLNESILIDCSHGNAVNSKGQKDFNRQGHVVRNIVHQLSHGEPSIIGVMLESNIKSGRQDFIAGKTDPRTLERGVSITDGCIDIPTTKNLIRSLQGAVSARRVNFG